MTDDDNSPYMGADELRKHFRTKFKELVGTEDLGEGNRRLAVLQEWRRSP